MSQETFNHPCGQQSPRHHRAGLVRDCLRSIALLLVACVAVGEYAPAIYGQLPATVVGSPNSAEPIYWRQNLFLIPYQWNATTDPATAQSVWLYVSKDRGASWQQISEARPQVRAFNYHAEADGEYWFAIRTVDARGAASPHGPMQPELRVIVDTSIPRVDGLSGTMLGDGSLELRWTFADSNFDAARSNVEVQLDGSNVWTAIPLGTTFSIGPGVAEGRTIWMPPAGNLPTAIRATIYDRAGNRAVYQSGIPAAADRSALQSGPALVGNQRDDPNSGGTGAATAEGVDRESAGWVSTRADRNQVASQRLAEPQFWPAESTGPPIVAHTQNADPGSADRQTGFDSPPATGSLAAAAIVRLPEPDTDHRPLGEIPVASERRFAPLEPFRQVSMKHGYDLNTISPAVTPVESPTTSGPGELAWLAQGRFSLPAEATARLVNSRTFALEYELEEVGPWGVAKVELWGTRDNGHTWRCYAADDDQRSPLEVTVDGAGLYGFRIVVEGTGGVGGFAPQSGDRPDLWVGVDLQRPQVELNSATLGTGSSAGKLVLSWYADDDNLEARPIALFYSSRLSGPWTVIATHVENSGEFAWRLERHLPRRLYLRIEARDTAGNLAVYQTTEPVAIEYPLPNGRIESVEAVEGPMARATMDSSR